jgi:SnoaL-like domain
VDGDEGEGEVYAIAYHIIPDREGGWTEDFGCVRYLDRYRREAGRWRFAQRVVTYDLRRQRPFPKGAEPTPPPEDPSFEVLKSRLFSRGPRA